ncbi:MAG: PhoH family protein [Planctomycetota bacterium]|jgi:phosphate starvation-inducible PhoH-like protein
MAQQTLPIDTQEQIRGLFGCQDQFLKRIRERLGVEVVVRGEELRLSGTESQVNAASDVFRDLQLTLDRHGEVFSADVEQALARTSAPEPLDDASTANGTGDSHPADSPAAHPMSSNLTRTGKQRQPPGAFRLDRSVDDSRAAEEPRGSDLNRSPPGAQSLDDASINLFEKARRVKPRTPGQARYVEAIRENDLVFCTGPAGCGKTYLAVAMALNALRTEQVRKIVLVRPAVEAGEKLGFLPGDLLAKVNPYLRPLLDALADILSFDQVKRYMEHDIIEIVPLAYMRGRTLNDTFIILDEAQNTTATQMKMFLTRMGEHSKIVVTGDPTQIDLPGHMLSGLKDATQRLEGIPGVEAVRLSGQDIVRHRLVREIVRAYDADDQPPSGAQSRRK